MSHTHPVRRESSGDGAWYEDVPCDQNHDELAYQPTTGAEAEKQFAAMMARLRSRYRLQSVSGRPEELIRPVNPRGVSLGYGCKTIRLRLMDGRKWDTTYDFQIAEGWEPKLDELCDRWFGLPVSPLLFSPKNEISDRRTPRS